MNDKRVLGLRVAAAIFAVVAVAHSVRFVTGFGIVIAGHAVPEWASAVAVIAAGGLSAWLWKLSR